MDPRALGFECEKAISLLANAMPATLALKKPTLFHSIRVGSDLYLRGYPREMVLAGFLHDLLEDTDVSADQIEAQFGKRVLEIVQANSRDASIPDPHMRKKDVILRSIQTGSDALTVKLADIVDNFKYYTSLNDKAGLEYGTELGNLILEHLPKGFKDPLLDELKAFLR